MLLTPCELCSNPSSDTLACWVCLQVRASEGQAAQPLLFQPGALRSSQPRPSSGAAVAPPVPLSGSTRWRPVARTCTAMCQSTRSAQYALSRTGRTCQMRATTAPQGLAAAALLPGQARQTRKAAAGRALGPGPRRSSWPSRLQAARVAGALEAVEAQR